MKSDTGDISERRMYYRHAYCDTHASRHPTLRFVAGGLSYRCKYCKAFHFISRAVILRYWEELGGGGGVVALADLDALADPTHAHAPSPVGEPVACAIQDSML